jgi:predicted ATP-binding protein involved in virulence
MRLHNLSIKNIGPFNEGQIDFISKEDNTKKPPVTIITGENGTGKTVILDAIRGLLLGQFNSIERNIVRNNKKFSLSLAYTLNNQSGLLTSNKISSANNSNAFMTNNPTFSDIFCGNKKPNLNWNWVIDYWTSKVSNDSFELLQLVSPKNDQVYINSLNGIQPNIEVVQFVCFIDYLKNSDKKEEGELGTCVFEIIKKIFQLSLIDGELKYVERSALKPIVSQAGQEVSIEKLSSGNLYLIQRLISLLVKMYSLHIINKGDIENLCNLPGLLLIDEAENHLHPTWQKTFIKSILEIFPNLQIIVTTHSPFIVSSVDHVKVYVCNSKTDHVIISDETDIYSNKPVEEILLG